MWEPLVAAAVVVMEGWAADPETRTARRAFGPADSVPVRAPAEGRTHLGHTRKHADEDFTKIYS